MTYKVDFKSKSVKRAVRSIAFTVEAGSPLVAIRKASDALLSPSNWLLETVEKIA